MGPGGPGHPAVQRRRHLAGHGRLPVLRDEDLPLGKLQVSRASGQCHSFRSEPELLS